MFVAVIAMIFICQLNNGGGGTTPLLPLHHIFRLPLNLQICCPPPMFFQTHLLLPHHVKLLGGAIVDDQHTVTMIWSGWFEQGLDIYQGIGIYNTG